MDQKFLEIAKEELGEDTTKREQSLVLFRSWLKSHPFLSGVRQDDVHLLLLLRRWKFSMDSSYKKLERIHLSIKKYPQFFCKDLEKIDALLETGIFCPLIDRDQDCRKIVLVRLAKVDMNIFKTEDLVKVIVYGTMVLLEQEETQITGISFISDAEGITRSHICSPSVMIDLLDLARKIYFARVGTYFILNLNSFAQVALDFITPLIKKKVKDRIVILKSLGELKDHIDVSSLPKEYGGKVPAAEMMKEFLKLKEEKKDLVNRISINSDIDWSKVSPEMLEFQDNSETIGSFRKLEID